MHCYMTAFITVAVRLAELTFVMARQTSKDQQFGEGAILTADLASDGKAALSGDQSLVSFLQWCEGTCAAHPWSCKVCHAVGFLPHVREASGSQHPGQTTGPHI